MLHGHGGKITKFLENLKSSWQSFITSDATENGQYLVYNLAWDEAAEVHVNILEEGHAQQGDPGLYSSEDITVPSQFVASSLGLPAWQLVLHLLQALGLKPLSSSESLVEKGLTCEVELFTDYTELGDLLIVEVEEDLLQNWRWKGSQICFNIVFWEHV